jgi:hypothetical protein
MQWYAGSPQGLITSTGWQFATGTLLAHSSGSYLYIKPGSNRPAAVPVTHALMLPVDSINIFVILTDAIDNFNDFAHRAMRTTMLLTQEEYEQA